MTLDDFNKKYEPWLTVTFYGLSINIPEVILYLDKRFQEFTKRDDFKFQQIKLKFGQTRFYADGLSNQELEDVEFHVDKLYENWLKKERSTEHKYIK